MQEISDRVIRTKKWRLVKAKEVAETFLAEIADSQLSWDEDAGEDWIAITNKSGALGLIHTKLGLILIHDSLCNESWVPRDAEVIQFHEYAGEPEFAMNPEILSDYFGVSQAQWGSADVDHRGFTPNDLVFMTI